MFTGIILHYLIEELNTLKGLIVRDVLRKGMTLSLDFGRRGITASLNPKFTHIAIKKIKGDGYFSSIFRGERIEKFSQNGLDRLIEVKLTGNKDIVFELFGRHSNCYLLRNNNIVNSFKGNRKGIYRKPEVPEGLDILESDRETLINAIKNGEVISGLTVGFVNRLREKEADIIESFAERKRCPTIYKDLLSPYKLPGGCYFDSFNEAILSYYKRLRESEAEKSKREKVFEKIESEIRNVESAIEGLSSIEAPEIYRRKGEAILTNINQIEKGMDKVKLNYLDEDYDIELNPSITPQENAQNFFELYKKAKKKRESRNRKKKYLENKLRELKEKKIRLQEGDEIDVFSQLLEQEKKEGKKVERTPKKFREFTTTNGYKVLQGKNTDSNHELTFSVARPYDIFLHVKNATGPHTILRVKDKDKNPPMEDIEEAAVLAARFSKLRNAEMAPVSYTQKRYVRSGKRLPKGKVLLEREKVIYVKLN